MMQWTTVILGTLLMLSPMEASNLKGNLKFGASSHVKFGDSNSDLYDDKERRIVIHKQTDELPKEFDARVIWEDCWTIGKVLDESRCATSGIISAISVMSDRFCIHSNQSSNILLSAQDVLSCCTYCGSGCNFEYPHRVWDYMEEIGIVSGGAYSEEIGCKPFLLAPCTLQTRVNCLSSYNYYTIPGCVKECRKEYGISYEKDKHNSHPAYRLQKLQENIMREIYLNGPVQANFSPKTTFLNYRSGIYSGNAFPYGTSRSVKIIGWGEEDGVAYWLCVNSWNTDWGEEGLFRIVRGKNLDGIEGDVVAAMPNYHPKKPP